MRSVHTIVLRLLDARRPEGIRIRSQCASTRSSFHKAESWSAARTGRSDSREDVPITTDCIPAVQAVFGSACTACDERWASVASIWADLRVSRRHGARAHESCLDHEIHFLAASAAERQHKQATPTSQHGLLARCMPKGADIKPSHTEVIFVICV